MSAHTTMPTPPPGEHWVLSSTLASERALADRLAEELEEWHFKEGRHIDAAPDCKACDALDAHDKARR